MMAVTNTSSSTIASSDKPSEKRIPLKDIIMFPCIPLAIIGLIGNVIILCLFCNRRRNSRFFLYYQNIVFANIIVLFDVFVVFQGMYLNTTLHIFFIYLADMLQTLGYNTRFYILTAICVERYLVIFEPGWNKHRRPHHMSIMVCCILWSLSCLTSVVDNLACSENFIGIYNQITIECKTSCLIRIVIDIAISLPVMVFSTLAILFRTQRHVPLARLDVTIVITVAVYLLTDAPIRISHNIIYWHHATDMLLLVIVTQLLDSVNCAAIPFIFVIIGYWKKTPEEPFLLFLEISLDAEENMAERRGVDET